MIPKVPGLLERFIASRILANDQLLVVHGVWDKMIFKLKVLEDDVWFFSLINSSCLLDLFLCLLKIFGTRFFRFRLDFFRFRFRSNMLACFILLLRISFDEAFSVFFRQKIVNANATRVCIYIYAILRFISISLVYNVWAWVRTWSWLLSQW